MWAGIVAIFTGITSFSQIWTKLAALFTKTEEQKAETVAAQIQHEQTTINTTGRPE